ncbi:MAG: hypothetical protein GXO35_09090 [Gammaproteobacteria bacterium]|nr:hypothetical protein [Gammaproteobacteria bacterium]
MNLSEENITLAFLVIGWLLFAPMFIWSVMTAPWHKVAGDSGAQHVLLAATAVVFFTWQLAAGLGSGISFHFLLMTLATLMFGVRFTVLAMTLALLGVTFESDLGWSVFGLNALLMGLLPIVITHLLLLFSRRYLEPNFFVYVFFNAFLAGAVGVVASLGLGAWVMWVSESQTLATLKEVFIPFIPLMSTPEGFLNGMLIAVLILFKPNWVSSFKEGGKL